MRATKTAAGFASALFLCLLAVDPAGAQPASSGPMPAPPASAAPAEDGQWTMPAKNYASTRYSELDRDQRRQRRASCRSPGPSRPASTAARRRRRSSSATRCTSSRPIPNILYALDLTKPGAPLKWKYEPKPEPAAQGVACCDVVNRGAVYADGKIFYNTLDGHTVAVDAETGKEVVEHQARRHQQRRDDDDGAARREGQGARRQLAAASSACAAGSTALDADDRQDRLARLQHRPRQGRADRPGLQAVLRQRQGHRTSASRPGRRTPGRSAAARSGAGSPTTPSSNLIYYGTGNPGPVEPGPAPGRQQVDRRHLRARPRHRRGALVLPDGSPHDLLRLRRRQREHPARPGRGTGSRARCSSAPSATATSTSSTARPARCCRPSPFGTINSTTGVDLKTGRLQYESRTRSRRWARSCATSARPRPAPRTGSPSAFSPRTGLLYIPHNNLCMDVEGVEANYIAGTPYVGAERADVRRARRPSRRVHGLGRRGRRKRSGRSTRTSRSGAARSRPPATSSSTERWTAGSRRSTRAPARCCGSSRPAPGSSASRSPIAGPDGKQYVAILSGVGGWAGAIVAGDLDPRDGTAALGFVNAMRDLQGRHDARAACSMCSRCRRPGCGRCWRSLALARVPGGAAARRPQRELRVCADPEQPAVLQRRAARASRTGSSSCIAARPRRRPSPTPGGRSGAASSATR